MTLPVFYWLSVIAALLYGVAFCWRAPSALRTAVKTTALGALALFAAANGAPVLLIAALALSALGDWALARPGESRFLIGLSSFALAHLCYIFLLVPGAGMPPMGLAALVIGLALSTHCWLLPRTDRLRGAVTLYVVLITVMGLLALSQEYGLLRAGALAFIASDALLALQLFRLPRDSRWHLPASILLWALYVSGQLALTWGILHQAQPHQFL